MSKKTLKRITFVLLAFLTVAVFKILYDLPLAGYTFDVAQSASRMQANQKKLTRRTQAKVHNVSLQELTKGQRKMQKTVESGMVGALVIPSQQIKLPIMNEATNETLMVGAAQYYPKRQMGRGNYILASHNFGDADMLLHRIERLKRGDRIFVNDGRRTYTYEVTKNAIVNEMQTELLEETKLPQITLIRCEGPDGTPLRRVVIGRLVKTKSTVELSKLTTVNGWYDRLLAWFGQSSAMRYASWVISEWMVGRRLVSFVVISVILSLLSIYLIAPFKNNSTL